MGAGRWSSEDYTSYARTTNYQAAPQAEVFRSSSLPAELDPSRIRLRESCDSADNPCSTPIILALDVTGSMGRYATDIAKHKLPELMSAVLDRKPVQDPHLMFMGIDDVHASSPGPLQVSQFEADIRILEQLRKVWIVGQGGGNRSESYDLAWYFAAHRTAIDSYEKRGTKGFLFTFGDEEAPYEALTASELQRVFGPGQYTSTTPEEVLRQAKERWHVFHVVIEQGSYFQSEPDRVRRTWNKLLDTNALYLRDFNDLTEVVLATMRVVRGEDMETVIAEAPRPEALRHAFRNSLVGG